MMRLVIRYGRMGSGPLVGLLLAASTLLGGCFDAAPESTAAAEQALVPYGLEAHGTVQEPVWRAAPSGCEGRIGSVHRVARAANAPGLVVVVGPGGSPVCVDSVESVAVELRRLEGDPSPDPMMPLPTGLFDDAPLDH